MKLIGDAVLDPTLQQIKALQQIEPNTVLVVISDETGKPSIVKVNLDSIPQDVPFLTVTTVNGCWIRIDGQLVWRSPCPYKR